MRNLFIISLAGFILSCNTNSNTPANNISDKDKQQIIDREIKSWEYIKTREFDKLKEVLADDYIGYFGRNVMTEADVMKSVDKAVLRSYAVTNIKVKPITNDVAVMYYLLDQDGTGDDGKLWEPHVAAAATYVKRNGVWYAVFYQETVLEK